MRFWVFNKASLKPVYLAAKTSESIDIVHVISLTITISRANNKGADQIARMRRLVCTFVVCMQQNQI